MTLSKSLANQYTRRYEFPFVVNPYGRFYAVPYNKLVDNRFDDLNLDHTVRTENELLIQESEFHRLFPVKLLHNRAAQNPDKRNEFLNDTI